MALGLTSVKIQINSCYFGMALSYLISYLRLLQNCFFLGIVRGKRMIIESAEPTIYCGDDLLCVA
jgi:hypothetical protein